MAVLVSGLVSSDTPTTMAAVVLGMMGIVGLAVLLTSILPVAPLVGASLVTVIGASAIARAVLSAAAGAAANSIVGRFRSGDGHQP